MSEDRPINAQQLKQIQDNANLQLGKIVEQLQLRKWAVEQAFKIAPADPMKLATAIYDFVVQPATLKVTAE